MRRLRWVLTLCTILPVGLWVADRLFPLPTDADRARYSLVVAAADGTPLRAFADPEGVWRYRVGLEEVSPLYLEALLGFEDRWFRYHPGVNPFALLRAVWQLARAGHVVSGGSTLTMQVASLLDPHPRTVGGKLLQMLRALQLEWHLSKDEILALYVNRAPFGGPLQGVQAASFAYLGKPASRLSHAEAALLAALPQAPSRLRPDRHPARAERARDKVLDRLVRHEVWSASVAQEARREGVPQRFTPRPLMAPLLARRLKGRGDPYHPIATTIDAELQRALEEQLSLFAAELPDKTSVAILVVQNEGMRVRAYVGSVDFLDDRRFGHVDMVRALRSPGSTLKPFLYGFALEDGLVHSESLLVDAPQSFDGYRPANFAEGFSGPVSVREALQRSLNVPAVDLLQRLDPAVFAARLRNGGLRLRLPAGAVPNLSVVLGGAAVTLEDLVAAYACLGRGGLTAKLRFAETAPLRERRMLSEGAAWIVRDILESNPRPGRLSTPRDVGEAHRVAWKTGTSFGYRDAWAVGVTDDFTVGVWVGRPDGTPMPGHYGAVTAAPILFYVVDALPAQGKWRLRAARPTSVQSVDICWPLGVEASRVAESLCHERRSAFVLDGRVPPTLPDRAMPIERGYVLTYWLSPETGMRVSPGCSIAREPAALARWPLALEPWLSDALRARITLPELDPRCAGPLQHASRVLRIQGAEDGSVLRRAGPAGSAPTLTLTALGARDAVYWMVNGAVRYRRPPDEPFLLTLPDPGDYKITAMDQAGHYDRVRLTVVR